MRLSTQAQKKLRNPAKPGGRHSEMCSLMVSLLNADPGSALELFEETIKRREKSGLLPALKFNSRVTRYRLSDIERIEHEAQNRFGTKGKEEVP